MSFLQGRLLLPTGAGRRWSTRPYVVEVHRGWEAVELLKAPWDWLLSTHPYPLPCACWDAARALEAASPRPVTPLLVVLRISDRVEGLIPLEISDWFGGVLLRFLGQGLFHRHEPLISSEAARIDPRPVLRTVAQRLGRAVLFNLAGIRPEGVGAAWMDQGLTGAPGWLRDQARREVAVDLGGGWGKVRASLSGRLRQLHDRAEEIARDRGAIRLKLVDQPPRGSLQAAVEEMDRASGSSGPASPALMQALMDRAAPGGRVRLALLQMGDRTLAASVIWQMNRQAVELLAHWDAAHRDFAPDALLRLKVIEELARRETAENLLLPPDDRGLEWGLGAIPAYQSRYWGSPYPGLCRLTAHAGDWSCRCGSRSLLRRFEGILEGRASRQAPRVGEDPPALEAPRSAAQGRLLLSQPRGKGREQSNQDRDRHPAGTQR